MNEHVQENKFQETPEKDDGSLVLSDFKEEKYPGQEVSPFCSDSKNPIFAADDLSSQMDDETFSQNNSPQPAQIQDNTIEKIEMEMENDLEHWKTDGLVLKASNKLNTESIDEPVDVSENKFGMLKDVEGKELIMFELDRNYRKGKSDPDFTYLDLMTGSKPTYYCTGFDKDDYIEIKLSNSNSQVSSVTIQAGTEEFNSCGIKGAHFQAYLNDQWENLFTINLSAGQCKNFEINSKKITRDSENNVTKFRILRGSRMPDDAELGISKLYFEA